MCLGLATGYREPADKKECTYADLKQIHFPENIIDTELTSDDFLKALEYVKEYEQAIKEEQDFLKNGDEFHVEALKVCEVVKQALEKQIPKKVELWNNQSSCPNCKTLMGNIGDIENYKKYCDCGQALVGSDSDDEN